MSKKMKDRRHIAGKNEKEEYEHGDAGIYTQSGVLGGLFISPKNIIEGFRRVSKGGSYDA